MKRKCSKCELEKSEDEFYQTERTQRCKECRNATARLWYRANREKRIAQTTEYHKAHPEQVKATRDRFYKTDHSKRYFAEWQRRFRREQPERAQAIDSRRNQKEGRKQQFRLKAYRRRNQTVGSFTSEQFKMKWEMAGECCVYCNEPLAFKDATRDHKKPLILGGLNFIANIAPACRSCNSRKGAKYENSLVPST